MPSIKTKYPNHNQQHLSTENITLEGDEIELHHHLAGKITSSHEAADYAHWLIPNR